MNLQMFQVLGYVCVAGLIGAVVNSVYANKGVLLPYREATGAGDPHYV
jgi:hypothetical protein